MKKKWIVISTIVLIIGIIMTTRYFYVQNNPLVSFDTMLSQVDDKTYGSIGGLDTVKYPEKASFKHLISTIKITYSGNIEDIDVTILKDHRDLLGINIYWTGKSWEYIDSDNNEIEYYYDLILYTGETSEEELKNLLNKGTVNITWKINGEEKSKVYSLMEDAVF